MKILTPIRYAAFGALAVVKVATSAANIILHPDYYNYRLSQAQCALVGHRFPEAPETYVAVAGKSWCDRCDDVIETK